MKSLHIRKVTVSRMRERYAQAVLTFRITYVEMFQAKAAEKIKTHVSCSVPLLENRAVYEITWKMLVHPDRPGENVTRHMRVAWWLPMATNKYSEYAIIIAFLLQQWLPQHHVQYSACIVTSFPRNICKPSWQMCNQLRPNAARLIC